MQIGAQLGYRGMVRESLSAIRAELNAPDLTVIATGGFADWVEIGMFAVRSIKI